MLREIHHSLAIYQRCLQTDIQPKFEITNGYAQYTGPNNPTKENINMDLFQAEMTNCCYLLCVSIEVIF